MLVVDPNYRVSVEEALQHAYVNLWYDTNEVDAPPSGRYDSAVESGEHTVEDWKSKCILFKTYFLIDECLVLIYDEIKRYEVQHDIFGGAGPSLDLSLIPAATNPEG
jgi:c-Jun N-terminal kinase